MPKVTLIMPDGTGATSHEYDFEVAPVVGSIIELRVDEEKQFYRVDETWHSEVPSARIGYFAALIKEDGPERWASPEAYVMKLPVVDISPPPQAISDPA